MKRVRLLLVVVVLLVPCNAFAQEAYSASHYLPFMFVGPGRTSDGYNTLHFGGGLETSLWKGLGGGAELGYLGPFPNPCCWSEFVYGMGVLSLNGLFEPLQAGRRITPFATGGYTVAFTSRSDTAFNVGGGVNYWMRDGVALRVEFRDHVPMHDGTLVDFDFWEVRGGFTWKR